MDARDADLEELARYVEETARRTRAGVDEPAFPPDEYAARLARLRARMAADGFDLLLCFSMEAACWLHGYAPRWYKASSPREWPPLACTVVHADRERPLVFDTEEHRDLLAGSTAVADVRLSVGEDVESMLGLIVGELAREGLLGGRAGLERWALPNHAVATLVEERLADRGTLVDDATDVIRGARRVKTPRELATIEHAARICDVGLLRLREVLRPGITEREAWAEMVLAMARAGGEPAAIHELVAVGDVNRNHAWSSGRRIEQGDVLWADPCGVRHRYHANVARSFVVGPVPPAARRLGEIEAGAFDVLRDVARPGARLADVSEALRAYYVEAGVWELRGSGWLGAYELGLAFPPDWVGDRVWTVGEVAADDPRVIEAGEVGNYESVIGLVMIDTLIYGEDGTRTLSHVPLEVLEAGV